MGALQTLAEIDERRAALRAEMRRLTALRRYVKNGRPVVNGVPAGRRTRAHDILLAAREFYLAPFSMADLVVRVWQRDKSRWGMRGFEDLYPDSKHVAATLSKKRPDGVYPFKAWIVPHGLDHYRLTTEGAAEAKRIEGVK